MTVAVAHQVSATSAAAMRQAVCEARLRNTDLAVLHVVPETLDADREDAYRAGISDEIEKALQPDTDVSWTLHLATGVAHLGDAVVRLSDQVGAELLVIGARRRSPMGKALMGSVAQTVVLEANVPVLVVKVLPAEQQSHLLRPRSPAWDRGRTHSSRKAPS